MSKIIKPTKYFFGIPKTPLHVENVKIDHLDDYEKIKFKKLIMSENDFPYIDLFYQDKWERRAVGKNANGEFYACFSVTNCLSGSEILPVRKLMDKYDQGKLIPEEKIDLLDDLMIELHKLLDFT